MLALAKVFNTGRSQAVRIPKEYRFEGSDLIINRIGKTTMLNPKNDPWATLKMVAGKATKDFMSDRDQGALEERS
jgi:antitoxin VapB